MTHDCHKLRISWRAAPLTRKGAGFRRQTRHFMPLPSKGHGVPNTTGLPAATAHRERSGDVPGGKCPERGPPATYPCEPTGPPVVQPNTPGPSGVLASPPNASQHPRCGPSRWDTLRGRAARAPRAPTSQLPNSADQLSARADTRLGVCAKIPIRDPAFAAIHTPRDSPNRGSAGIPRESASHDPTLRYPMALPCARPMSAMTSTVSPRESIRRIHVELSGPARLSGQPLPPNRVH